MGKIFLSSDLHLNHGNMITYAKRPFEDVNHMNDEIIKRFNKKIQNDDTLIIVGDFCFCNTRGGKIGEGGLENSKYWLNKINGNKILIRGNHDPNNKLKTRILSMTFDIAGMNAFIVHNPKDYNKNYKINICGHVHEEWKIKFIEDVLLINVGVDVWDFYPVDLNYLTDFIIIHLKKYKEV